MSVYIRFILSLVIACSIYGLFVPVLVSMKDTTAVISGIALAILAPPCIYAICKGLVVTVHKEKK